MNYQKKRFIQLQNENQTIENNNENIEQNKKKNKLSTTTNSSNKQQLQISLGTWYFDKRSKKRRYLALSGKVYSGSEGMKRARYDQFSESHPAQLIRSELKYLYEFMIVDSYVEMLNNGQLDELKALSMWGIPDTLLLRYKQNKVTTLFPWQINCLLSDQGNVYKGNKNMIYSAPTSGGKTLVSELLMLRKIASTCHLKDPKLEPRKTIFFIVPFIALAEEKLTYFQDIWQDMNIGIRSFHQEDGTGNMLGQDVELAICTIERANILINMLFDEKREEQLSMIVIDEIHLLSDKQRGFLLEVILTKVKYLLPHVQVIGMSATLPNIHELAHWMNAALYITEYRPVNLDIMVCMYNSLYQAKVEEVQSIVMQEEVVDNIVLLEDENSRQSFQDSNASSLLLPPGDSHILIPEESNDSYSNYYQYLPPQPPTTKNTNTSTNNILNATSSTSTTVPSKPTTTRKKLILELSQTIPLVPNDYDGFLSIVYQTIQLQQNALVFCNSKKRCENCAKNIAEMLFRLQEISRQQSNHPIPSDNIHNNHASSPNLNYQLPSLIPSFQSHTNQPKKNDQLFVSYELHQHTQRQLILEHLIQTQVGLCPILKETIPYGIAYHHAGLTHDERKIIEQGFRQGVIQILCTTSTLSAGVNLPAHRVIIRSLQMGDQYLNVASFRQMCGRAGRLGFNGRGEAIILLSKTPSKRERDHSEYLLTAELEPLVSSLHLGQGGGIEKLLLEMITCGRLRHEKDILTFVRCTLLAIQIPSQELELYVNQAYIFLKQTQFIQCLNQSATLIPSPLGKATTLSGISPKDAVVILKSLLQARQNLVLISPLHCIYLITPPSTPIEPDWKHYEQLLDILYKEHPEAKLVFQTLQFSHQQLYSYTYTSPNPTSERTKEYKRFYSSIILFMLIQEWPLTRVSSYLTNITRGQLQQLQKESAIFCGMILIFCQKLNWHCLACALEDYAGRLNYGILHKELLPLVRISSEITVNRAKLFHKYEIYSAEDLLCSGVQRVTEILLTSLPFLEKELLTCYTKQPQTTSEITNINNSLSTHDRAKIACERLAKQILLKASEYLRNEMNHSSFFSST